MATAFRDGAIPTTGTAITKVLPPVLTLRSRRRPRREEAARARQARQRSSSGSSGSAAWAPPSSAVTRDDDAGPLVPEESTPLKPPLSGHSLA